ncbi:flagellar biosynthesis protein FlhB [Alkalilimnicola ehrlichii]|uniref:Flagellar biosynthetic protein FlhB n=1 Tax=Alkalilimnicola ehrlichii TaxID=351052 RepID=A0A3E0WRT4_9GAMM|nr:flagellar biosynthesis protein FlhB [Alkalilimnicola ehrlichii]RFA28532.1 flagellar biosynthesis protein FlhB [Alkalilimnicola ehrlichii]RFA35694.1 flagellar biosynthesis protein FlhB [Alkalilimnicola ehrlichii]
MAEENQDGQEKTEEPTPKRLRDAKEKGQVPRSRELNTAMVMMASAFGMMVFAGYIGNGLATIMETTFQPDRDDLFNNMLVFEILRGLIWQGLLLIAPFAAIVFVVAVAAPALIGGWAFSGKAMAPKLEKMSPIKGLKRMFGVKGLVELGKALAKVTVVGTVALLLAWLFQGKVKALMGVGLESGLALGAQMFFIAFFALSASLLLVAAVDVPYQLYEHKKKLRMTKQEVKDELKQTDGKPEVKGKIRQLQQQIARGRMMESIPEADVVITNPTHYAVALKYDQMNMRAPKVLAKGAGELALKIRELAEEHKVPLFEAPPLARALYFTTDLEQEIPGGLYVAVAQVLAYIYQVRSPAQPGQRPVRPDPELPDEFEKYTKMGEEEQ